MTRIPSALRITPAMAVGLTDRACSVEEIVTLMDETASKAAEGLHRNRWLGDL
jgi:hypothetical protein